MPHCTRRRPRRSLPPRGALSFNAPRVPCAACIVEWSVCVALGLNRGVFGLRAWADAAVARVQVARVVHMALFVWQPKGALSSPCDDDAVRVCNANADAPRPHVPGSILACLESSVAAEGKPSKRSGPVAGACRALVELAEPPDAMEDYDNALQVRRVVHRPRRSIGSRTDALRRVLPWSERHEAEGRTCGAARGGAAAAQLADEDGHVGQAAGRHHYGLLCALLLLRPRHHAADGPALRVQALARRRRPRLRARCQAGRCLSSLSMAPPRESSGRDVPVSSRQLMLSRRCRTARAELWVQHGRGWTALKGTSERADLKYSGFCTLWRRGSARCCGRSQSTFKIHTTALAICLQNC